MTRIEKRFKELKAARKKAFIVFITAGYPNLNITEKLILEFSRIGVDIIELGVPFSDPMADGPIIQEASEVALKKGVNLSVILKMVKKIRKYTDTPICFMTYYNPIFCFGDERFIKAARSCGVDGVIIPDLPPEEGLAFITFAHKHRLDVICFVSPTTSRERLRYIAAISRGFIYYVSLTGVTGPRQALAIDIAKQLREIKRTTDKPVCVGFGISNPQQVKRLYKIADGVIVGSAIIKKIKENMNSPALVAGVGRFVRGLKDI